MNSPLLRSLAMAHKLRILNVRQIYRVVSRPSKLTTEYWEVSHSHSFWLSLSDEARKSLFRETEGHRIHRAKEPVFEAAVSALYPEPLSSVPNADLESDLLQFIEDAVRYKKDSEGVLINCNMPMDHFILHNTTSFCFNCRCRTKWCFVNMPVRNYYTMLWKRRSQNCYLPWSGIWEYWNFHMIRMTTRHKDVRMWVLTTNE